MKQLYAVISDGRYDRKILIVCDSRKTALSYAYSLRPENNKPEDLIKTLPFLFEPNENPFNPYRLDDYVLPACCESGGE